jgi:ribosomal protein S18 acetylase RimI-like enzyme
MISVRRIQIGEGNVYREVRLRALSDAPAAFLTTYAQSLEREPESWAEQADRAACGVDRAIFLLFANGDPVGLAALYRHPEQNDTGELLQVWVAPEHRGNGSAAALLDGLMQWGLAAARFQSILAEVKTGNERALGFYRKYGFLIADGLSASDPGETMLHFAPLRIDSRIIDESENL